MKVRIELDENEDCQQWRDDAKAAINLLASLGEVEAWRTRGAPILLVALARSLRDAGISPEKK